MATHAENLRNWRAYQRIHGNCPNCGQKRDGDTMTCRRCLAKKSERAKAQRARNREAGLTKPRGWNGFQLRPSERYAFASPEERRTFQGNGSIAAAQSRMARVTEAVMRDVRRLLFNVRSAFTAEQIQDLEPIIAVIYKRGIERGVNRERDKRYRRQGSAA